MLRVEDSVLVLLAAGRSRRFGGPAGKLDQDLLGLPLGLHAAVALAAVPFLGRVAIVGDPRPDYAPHGFEVVRNPDRDRGMATSVRLGIARAVALGARSAVIALADMPRVTAAHVVRLFDAGTDAASVVASSDGRAPGPPALFGAAQFDRMLALDGDTGARALLRGGRHVVTAAAELVDVDTVADLEALRRRLHDPGTSRR